MREYKIQNEEKILFQNNAVLIDSFDGCLIDNYLYQAKNGLIALFERPLNCWSSEHVFMFARSKKEQRELENMFYSRMADCYS